MIEFILRIFSKIHVSDCIFLLLQSVCYLNRKPITSSKVGWVLYFHLNFKREKNPKSCLLNSSLWFAYMIKSIPDSPCQQKIHPCFPGPGWFHLNFKRTNPKSCLLVSSLWFDYMIKSIPDVPCQKKKKKSPETIHPCFLIPAWFQWWVSPFWHQVWSVIWLHGKFLFLIL